MSTTYWRVQIVEQPEWEERVCFDTVKYGPHEGETFERVERCPADWFPSADYIEHRGTDKWIMPKTEGPWRSRSSAAARRDLLNRAGFTAIVQRSAPIVWPDEGQERVDSSSAAEVIAALRTLKRHGAIRSMDEIL